MLRSFVLAKCRILKRFLCPFFLSVRLIWYVTENWDWRFSTMQVCPFFVNAAEKFLKIRIEGLARCRNALAWIRRSRKKFWNLFQNIGWLILCPFFLPVGQFFGFFFYYHTWEKCLEIGNAELHRNASAWINRLKKV